MARLLVVTANLRAQRDTASTMQSRGKVNFRIAIVFAATTGLVLDATNAVQTSFKAPTAKIALLVMKLRTNVTSPAMLSLIATIMLQK